MTDGTQRDWGAIFDVALKVAFPILLGMAGWTFNNLQDVEKRLTIIEASRYTRSDARSDREELKAEMLKFREVQIRIVGDLSYIKRSLDKITDKEKDR